VAGYLLEAGKHDVSLLARGERLAAIRERGLIVESHGRRLHSRPRVSAVPEDFGPQDVLFLTVKGHGLPALATALAPMIGPETVVVSAQNGIPWWYFYGDAGPECDTPFEIVDPGGLAWRAIGPERALGCVIYLPAHIESAGIVQHEGISRLILGAPRAGQHAAVLDCLAGALSEAGIEVVLTEQIRHAVWSKLMLNGASATLSVLTGSTVGQLQAGPGMPDIRARLKRETLATARAWNIDLPDEIDQPPGAGVSGHKPSMLQDYEARRPLELDAIVTSVIDLAARRRVPVPTIETLRSTLIVKLTTERYPGMTLPGVHPLQTITTASTFAAERAR